MARARAVWVAFSATCAATCAPASARADEEPQEVVVSGTRDGTPTADAKALSRSEIRLLPGAFGDPFRAIDSLPGVVPLFSGLPYFYVRGAPPSNVGYFLDDVRVPYLFHFGLGPGVLPAALVERVDLHAGGYPAEFGRYAGGVVSGVTAGPRDRMWGEAQVRAFDAGAVIETPFADGKGHVLVGGRFSYTGPTISLLAPDVQLDYRDYTARFTYDLSPRDRLTVLTFGAYDLAVQTEDGEKHIAFASEFHRIDTRWDRAWSDRTASRVAITLGYDRSRLEGERFARDATVNARGRIEHTVSPALRVRAGFDTNLDVFDGDPPNPATVSRADYRDSADFFSRRVDTQSGAWLEAALRLPGGTQIVPGLRGDVFTSRGNYELAIDPRLSVRVPILGPRLRAVFAQGIAHQPYAFAIPIPALSLPGLPDGLQAAYETSATLESELPAGFFASASGFHHEYRKVHDLFAVGGLDAEPFSRPPPLSGRAVGLEVLVRRAFSERIGGLVSYTLSRSTRDNGHRETVNGFDRTHVLNAALTANLGAGFRVGARTLFYTGIPDPLRPREIGLSFPRGIGAPSDLGDDRLASFVRLDVRAEKRWSTAQGWFAIVLEGLNVTLGKETIGYRCQSDVCSPNAFGPITIPSIGLEGGF